MANRHCSFLSMNRGFSPQQGQAGGKQWCYPEQWKSSFLDVLFGRLIRGSTAEGSWMFLFVHLTVCSHWADTQHSHKWCNVWSCWIMFSSGSVSLLFLDLSMEWGTIAKIETCAKSSRASLCQTLDHWQGQFMLKRSDTWSFNNVMSLEVSTSLFTDLFVWLMGSRPTSCSLCRGMWRLEWERSRSDWCCYSWCWVALWQQRTQSQQYTHWSDHMTAQNSSKRGENRSGRVSSKSPLRWGSFRFKCIWRAHHNSIETSKHCVN